MSRDTLDQQGEGVCNYEVLVPGLVPAYESVTWDKMTGWADDGGGA